MRILVLTVNLLNSWRFRILTELIALSTGLGHCGPFRECFAKEPLNGISLFPLIHFIGLVSGYIVPVMDGVIVFICLAVRILWSLIVIGFRTNQMRY